jgi:hypothetical protein
VVVTVLFNVGDQLPVMPFVEVVGNDDKVAPEHMADTGLNIGVTFEFTVTLTVEVPVHPVVVPVTV